MRHKSFPEQVELSNALQPKNSVGTQLLLQSLPRVARGMDSSEGWGVSECVKLRRKTFDIFAVKTPNYKPDSSVFSLGHYKQHPSPRPHFIIIIMFLRVRSVILFLNPQDEVGPSTSSLVVPCSFVLLVYIVMFVLVVYLCPSSVRTVATFSGIVLFPLLYSVLLFFP